MSARIIMKQEKNFRKHPPVFTGFEHEEVEEAEKVSLLLANAGFDRQPICADAIFSVVTDRNIEPAIFIAMSAPREGGKVALKLCVTDMIIAPEIIQVARAAAKRRFAAKPEDFFSRPGLPQEAFPKAPHNETPVLVFNFVIDQSASKDLQMDTEKPLERAAIKRSEVAKLTIPEFPAALKEKNELGLLFAKTSYKEKFRRLSYRSNDAKIGKKMWNYIITSLSMRIEELAKENQIPYALRHIPDDSRKKQHTVSYKSILGIDPSTIDGLINLTNLAAKLLDNKQDPIYPSITTAALTNSITQASMSVSARIKGN